MSDTLQFYCYWCGHHPTVIPSLCPSCGEHLTEVLPPGMGKGVVGPFEVRAWKDLMQAEDARVLRLLEEASHL